MILFKTFLSPFDNSTPIYDGTEINTATLGNGGSGWAINDLFVVNGGTLSAIGKVLAASSGVVTSFSILMVGYGYSITNGVPCTKVFGTGVGLTINITGLKAYNAKFAHSVFGNDSNSGTRTSPVQTITKLVAWNLPFRVAKGFFTENANISGAAGTTTYFILEEEGYINGNLTRTGYSDPMYFWNLKCKSATTGQYNCSIQASYSTLLTLDEWLGNGVNKYNFIGVWKFNASSAKNNTCLSFKNYASNILSLSNILVIDNIDLYRFSSQTATYPIFSYSLFRKVTLWQWNGITININWITNPNTSAVYTTENLLERVWNSLYYYANNTVSAGTDRTYFNLMLGSSFASCPIFYTDGMLGQTNRVIDDNPTTGVPVFNKYANNGVTVLDYTLNANVNNIALYMGDPASGSRFVGCYYPNIGNMTFGDIINVNSDGTDDLSTPPDMLVTGSDGSFSVNNASTQIRNRNRTNVLVFNTGYAPLNAQSSLVSGINAGFTFGKKRPWSTSQIACESIEVLPYDSLTTPSAFPKFSIPFNGNAQIFFKVATNMPLLFNDLAGIGVTTDINLTEYGNWAVTTADIESFILISLSSVVLKPLSFSYMKLELNINFNL